MRADLLQRVLLVCPSCTWKRGTPAALRLENAAGEGGEVLTGALRCVRCSEAYPVVRGVAVLVRDGYRRVAQEEAAADDPALLLAPHMLAHYGDLLPPAEREGLHLGDFWPRLAAEPAAGLALDLSASVGRATLGLAGTATFALGCESSLAAARRAREVLLTGRARLRIVEEGTIARVAEADAGALRRPNAEVVMADPDLPPVAPGRAGLVLAANVLERQDDPAAFLERADALLAPGGALVVASPCSFWEDGSARGPRLGEPGERTRDALVRLLAARGHLLEREEDLLLVLREHARLEQVVRPLLVRTRKGQR